MLVMRCEFSLMLATLIVRLTLSNDLMKPFEQPKPWLKCLLKVISKSLSLQNRTCQSFVLHVPSSNSCS